MLNITVIKRDGGHEEFDSEKLSDSISGAIMDACSDTDINMADDITNNIIGSLEENNLNDIDTETLQKIIENELINRGEIAAYKAYHSMSVERNGQREKASDIIHTMHDITFQSPEELKGKRENANINTNTAMGVMLKYGTEIAKKYNLIEVIRPEIAKAHINGDIHIHDLDFYTLTLTCCQLPLDKLFKGGFNTGHGYIREPGSIRTAASLTAIAIQANQNDQHGGQSVPMLDFYLAPYVALSYVKNAVNIANIMLDMTDKDRKEIKKALKEYHKEIAENAVKNRTYTYIMHEEGIRNLKVKCKQLFDEHSIEYTDDNIDKIMQCAHEETYDECHQAMEGLVHNLNTLHSRAGSQVPFSSLNFGTDTSVEGRMVIETLLKATEDGLGNGETPIFPISIFKLKDGVSFKDGDPNYDLRLLAERVSAKRMYPNFVNCDAPFNKMYYVEGHPETEAVAMGCRTRVLANSYDPNNQVVPGRGNLSFTSINLPRLAIRSKGDIKKFYKYLDEMLELVHQQLLDRFDVQCKKTAINFPFLLGQGNWIGSDNLGPYDDIRAVLKHGTLTVGFIGLAETLVSLTGKHHGESEESQKLGLEIIQHMRDYTDAWSRDEHMNYSVIGTPAEGLSGRFIRLDKEKYGVIPGVTDKDYYTNSSHVPVWYNITAQKKVDIEAPYHSIENGGHILYIEIDGDPSTNMKAFHKLVDYMHDAGAGYFAINHPLDSDPVCQYRGIIKDVCPRCGRRDGEPMTNEVWNRLKGYIGAGNASNLGACGNPDEEADRITNEL